MDPVVTFLYNQSGEKTDVQLLYDEYLRLSDLNQELPLYRIKLKQIAELLGAAPSDDDFPLPLPVRSVHESYTEPIQEQQPESEPEYVVPKSAFETVSEPALVTDSPADRDIRISEKKPVDPAVKEYTMPIPPMLLDFLTEQDPSQKAKRLIMACAQKLSSLCGKRITLSLHKPYICLWDFDEWKTFAFGEIIQGYLYLSVESSLQPHANEVNVWVPPSGLCKKPLVRRRVDAITDELLEQLTKALNHLDKPVSLNI